MTKIYCSRGHENPPGSRFCLQCGENLLDLPVIYGIQPGLTLGDRYVIVRQIGQGGFGRTYLVEDINRFREFCVLKEFSPQVQTAYVLQKAEELFQREAEVLYKLQHPQIPRFRELFRMNLQGKEYLFLVQDYVEGQTYNSLLNARKQQGLRFTETEVRQLLQQILPVLEYIHSMGVIHRDISPDNLILRTADQLPVLIDFGGVKQVVATVASQYYQPGVAQTPAPTLLGKIGFAPPEQMQSGAVSPHSDLYALAVTILVLLTSKQPQDLLDNYTLSWKWQQEVSLSPILGQVLNKMLAPRPSDRYQSASQVLHALNPAPVYYPPTQAPMEQPPATSATFAVAPSPHTPPAPQTPISPSPVPPQQTGGLTPAKTLFAALAVVGVVGITVWGLTRNNHGGGNIAVTPTPSVTQPVDASSQYSPEEKQRKARLSDRRQQLGISQSFYIDLVNQIFWQRNPSLQGRTLSDGKEDESLRAAWDKTADELLDKLSVLSANARQQLGNYTASDRDRWKVQVNQVNVGSRALYDLGDAAFYNVFPQQRGKEFLDQPIGQVWYGFVSDKVTAILAGSVFQKIVFDAGATNKTVSGTLKPGGGKVLIAELAQGQTLELNLKANSQVLLSVYSPSGKVRFLEDSTKRTLSTELPENGFYEFAIASTASSSVEYQLSITATSPAPIETPTPTPTPTETSSPSPTPTPTETNTPSPTPTSIETTP
ncbi:serine/threonine-protein kinase [Nostoc sp. FACHB-110]|uniref:serine/threonine-protein kinase n=1 Tax=Nostoc sp. FACHB-110 TaxID=2692834 RepID=UPI001684123D|nr:serine/threonine-protein kinase [Nostoc sp. FACHB-110]MBD2436892.1 protein kinase [Nostoc sp. FACHB-110]